MNWNKRTLRDQLAECLAGDEAWLVTEERALRADLLTYVGACAALSRRYFHGHDVLFPNLRKRLESLIETLNENRDFYTREVAPPIPETEPELLTWLLKLVREEAQPLSEIEPTSTSTEDVEVRQGVTSLVYDLVNEAWIDTLGTFGDHDQAADLLRQDLRDVLRRKDG